MSTNLERRCKGMHMHLEELGCLIDDPTSVYKNPLTEAEEMFGDKVIVFEHREERKR